MNRIAIDESKPGKEGTRISTADIAEIEALILDALGAFTKDVVGCEWCGKEHDYVNRFAHGFLVPRCAPSSFLHDPTQIGIEVGVAQPRGVDIRGASRKDLVIWPKPGMSCWGVVNDKWKPVNCPAVVMEWKVVRAGQKLRADPRDRKWLSGFARTHPGSLGYSVTMTRDLVPTGRIVVARFQGTKVNDDWFRL